MKLEIVFGSKKMALEIPSPGMKEELSSFYSELAAEKVEAGPAGEAVEEAPAAEDEWTVGRLKEEVEKLTRVPVAGQRLLCRGKTLSSTGQPLSELGLREGEKVMVLGSATPTAEEDALMRELKAVERQTSEELRGRLEAAESQLKGLEGGFLPEENRAQARKELRKRLLVTSEECMRCLLKLDGLTLETGEQRAKRKALVDQLNRLLSQHDDLVARLTALEDHQ